MRKQTNPLPAKVRPNDQSFGRTTIRPFFGNRVSNQCFPSAGASARAWRPLLFSMRVATRVGYEIPLAQEHIVETEQESEHPADHLARI